MRILVAIGTRPEIIKLAPVVAALRAGHDVHVVATGQHYDASLTDAFYEALGLVPDERWQLQGREAERLGALLQGAHEVVVAQRPDAVLVLGDTHTVPLFGLAARAHQVPVIHVEAGLRSFNETSTEEVNRRVAAAVTGLHLAPTERAAGFLRAEGVDPARIHVVGNPVIDALVGLGVERRSRTQRAGVVFTAHRATNVDDPARLATLVETAVALAERCGPVRFPVHPRTAARLEATGLHRRLVEGGVARCEPLPYREMLEAIAASAVVVTDSGGLQEEAAYFGVPVVVLRDTTPRWEGVDAGSAVLCGVDRDAVLAAVARLTSPAEQARIEAAACPYGDGMTAARIAALLDDPAVWERLRLRPPQPVGLLQPA